MSRRDMERVVVRDVLWSNRYRLTRYDGGDFDAMHVNVAIEVVRALEEARRIADLADLAARGSGSEQ